MTGVVAVLCARRSCRRVPSTTHPEAAIRGLFVAE
jgi:hypothetical protein